MSDHPLPVAHYTGEVLLWDTPWPCAVLESPGEEPVRLLDASSALAFFGEGARLFLDLAGLPHLAPGFRRRVTSSVMPIAYADDAGQAYSGIVADLFQEVILVYWRAWLNHALPPQAQETGERCAAMVDAMARSATVWLLVDEATGYDAVRAPGAVLRAANRVFERDSGAGQALRWMVGELGLTSLDPSQGEQAQS
jgi:hypothetical protein